jgi:hypothetical protein
MAKLKPEERWNRLLLERFQAFRITGELKRLRAEGLKILGRKTLLTALEFKKLPVREVSYLNWAGKCDVAAKRFGLAPWTVRMACLLEDYDPVNSYFPVGAQWPSIRVITVNTNSCFLRHLSYHAWSFGVRVYTERNGLKSGIISSAPEPPDHPLQAPDRPTRDEAFTIELRFPPNYPPEAAQNLSREACEFGRELLRRLGYRAAQRLRATRLLAQTDALKVNEFPLHSGDTYNIIDKMWPDEDLGRDQQRRKLVHSRRHGIRKRLTEPYK